jgi:hypothetical protein
MWLTAHNASRVAICSVLPRAHRLRLTRRSVFRLYMTWLNAGFHRNGPPRCYRGSSRDFAAVSTAVIDGTEGMSHLRDDHRPGHRIAMAVAKCAASIIGSYLVIAMPAGARRSGPGRRGLQEGRHRCLISTDVQPPGPGERPAAELKQALREAVKESARSGPIAELRNGQRSAIRLSARQARTTASEAVQAAGTGEVGVPAAHREPASSGQDDWPGFSMPASRRCRSRGRKHGNVMSSPYRAGAARRSYGPPVSAALRSTGSTAGQPEDPGASRGETVMSGARDGHAPRPAATYGDRCASALVV